MVHTVPAGRFSARAMAHADPPRRSPRADRQITLHPSVPVAADKGSLPHAGFGSRGHVNRQGQMR